MNFLSLFRVATPKSLLGGRYDILGQLGAGGFGQTFLAEDRHLPGHPRCVVKRLQPQVSDARSFETAKRLFDTEAKVLYQLGDHDQIPRLLAHFEHAQEFYLAQELVVGEPLTQELSTGQVWAEGQVFTFLCDLLSVLTFVHQQNVIHRDIKPANLIRRRRDGRIVLIDFGAVKQATTQLANPNSGPTQTIAIGTQGYMPNEQIVGNPRFCSDVYAVGMIGIQALTGTSPRLLRENPQTGEIEWRHLAPHVNPVLADVLDRMVCYDFRARYPTAAEALVALEELSIPTAIPTPVPIPSNQLSTTPPPVSETFPLGQVNPTTAPKAIALHNVSAGQDLETIQPAYDNPNKDMIPSTITPWLSWLRKPSSRKVIVPAAELIAVGLLVILIRFLAPSPDPNPTTTSNSSSPAPSGTPATPAPSATPTPSATPAVQIGDVLAQADQLREQAQFQQALDRYDQAIALDPKTATAHWGRCYSLNRLQKLAEAIAACDAALAINPNYPEALWSKGYALDQQQQYQEALKLYEQAIALKSDFAEAWSNKGTALLQLNRPADAVLAFDRATSLEPTLAEAWNNRGAALWSLRRFDEAIGSVDRAIQLQPDYQDALSLRQQMRQRLGR